MGHSHFWKKLETRKWQFLIDTVEKCQMKMTSLQWLFLKNLEKRKKCRDIGHWNSAKLIAAYFIENGGGRYRLGIQLNVLHVRNNLK